MVTMHWEVGWHSPSAVWRAEIMAANSLPLPGPDEPRSLSRRELEILAGIEDDLSAADPALAKRLSGRPSTVSPASSISVSKGGAVGVGLLIGMAGVVLMPPGLLLLVALLTILVVVPWMLLRTIERQYPR
jgi:hypothetical protein